MARRRVGTSGTWLAATLAAALAVVVPVLADGPALIDARPHFQGGWLSVDLTFAELIDQRTRSTIDSGLSGICAYEVTLLDEHSRPVGRRRWVLHLEHDLWEDRYRVRGPDGTHDLASLAAVDSVVSMVSGVRLAIQERLDPDREYRLQVAVEVQPLGAEDQDRLVRYISHGGGRGREELDLDLGSLFGRLFSGSDGGTTTLDHAGAPFRPQTLERRP